MAGKHRADAVTVVGNYRRKPRLFRPSALDIVARLVGERNARKAPGEYAEPMPTRGTVTRHAA